ncbi:MAG: hypothetical protein KDC71_00435 [Acidobacteria bacterium]|nr:hypothetical protein [Acidobacteriota bacterium]
MMAHFAQFAEQGLKVKGIQAIANSLVPLLSHENCLQTRSRTSLVTELKNQFLEGKWDFYCWDELTKGAEMKFFLSCQLEPCPIVELYCGYAFWVRQVAELFDWHHWLEHRTSFGFKIRTARACIDRERSLLDALSFAPDGFGSNPKVKHYSQWLPQIDGAFFEQAGEWLCAWVDPPQADLYLFEVEK